MKKLFGYTQDGREVWQISLSDKNGNTATFITLGASIQSLKVFDTDVALGFDTVSEYETNGGCSGQVVGRCANRIGGACFELDGKKYNVSPNKGTFTLHGGFCGFNKKVWDFEEGEGCVTFSLFSEDGDEGFPGNVVSKVKYSFSDAVLTVDYDAVSDKKTLINLTNHVYFNLNGEGKVLDQYLQVNAKAVAWSDSNSVPNGDLVTVEGTPFDYRTEKKVGWGFDSGYPLLMSKNGLDHNFILEGQGSFRKVATLFSDKTNIRLNVFTDQDVAVIYSASNLTEMKGKYGQTYGRHSGICFETQYMTNAVNLKGFRKPVFDKDEHFTQHTEFRFSKN